MSKQREPSMTEIRQAITRHRGGWKQAKDAQLLRLWRDLPPEVREAYLTAVREKQTPPRQ